jgi:hypothetical protein
MKQPEYIEGPEALENFERGMKAFFKVPKTATKKGKQKDRPNASLRKPKSLFEGDLQRARPLFIAQCEW